MTRSADYTIQGFIYQFNKTLWEVLSDVDDSEIAIEGIIEDIEVKTTTTTKAIQCKYHESQEIFTVSSIYKPVLQMMVHFLDNPKSNIQYKLFAHFPNEAVGSLKLLTEDEIIVLLNSTNKSFQKYINRLKGIVDIESFCKVFSMEFGPSLESLIAGIETLLVENEMPEHDIETLIYPNAIQKIADLSILHDSTKRVIKKKDLLSDLLKIKKTAVTRWTLELKTIDKILRIKKLQLRENLNKNSRTRYFILSEESIEDFNEVIVNFISEYLSKYHFKDIHDKTPLFCLDCSWETFKKILIRLYKKQIKANTGLLADHFEKNIFFEGPIRQKINKELFKEFHIRLLHYRNDHAFNVLNEIKGEDLYIFLKEIPKELDFEDINIELIDLNNIDEIKFVMGMSDVYE